MTMKSSLDADTMQIARYAIPAPRRSDTISGALRIAFASPVDDHHFTVLLTRIDQADRARGNA